MSEYDVRANALADRHYSRQTPGCGQIGGPGRRIVLLSACARALWLTHYPRPDLAQDGLDAYRCSIFRNEGAGLSSDLIVEAMEITERRWGPAPDAWVTWVDTRKVRSTNPGYCFLKAGWWIDRDWSPARGRRGKIRLRAESHTVGAQLLQLVLPELTGRVVPEPLRHLGRGLVDASADLGLVLADARVASAKVATDESGEAERRCYAQRADEVRTCGLPESHALNPTTLVAA